jgi:hypothetical protein
MPRVSLTGRTFQTSPVSRARDQWVSGWKFRRLGTGSYMPFLKLCPMCYPRVRRTAAMLSIRNAQVCDWRYVLCIIYVRATLMLLTNIRQRPALPLPSSCFFQTVFELQNTPDIQVSTMSLQLGMRRYGRLIGE